MTARQVQALASATTAVTAPPTGVPTTTSSVPAGTPTTASAGTTTTSAPAAAPTVAARQTRGVVVVGVEGDRLSLVSGTPEAGYSIEVKETGPDEVVVVFEGADGEIKVRAGLVEGRVVFTVEQETPQGG